MIILGVDPGKTTGWCRLYEDGTTKRGETKGNELTFQLLHNLLSDDEEYTVVVENYAVRPVSNKYRSFDHSWDRLDTVRIIGGFEYACQIHSVPYILQEPTIKPVGYGYAGLDYKPNSKHKEVHMDDAEAHAWFYAVNKKLIKPKGKPFNPPKGKLKW